MNYQHQPVMLEEAISYLGLKAGNIAVDCTLGGGGYTLKISEIVGHKGKVIAIDLDRLALNHAEVLIKERGLDNIVLVHDNFANLQEIVNQQVKMKINGIVLDLGLSSAQLADPERGFSFKKDTDLDMAFGDDFKVSTTTIVNNYQAKDLIKILKEYGEERYAQAIAQAIILQRKEKRITTTGQLTKIIEEAVPAIYKRGKIHCATKTFQALRIETNRELDNLKKLLPQALSVLDKGGRLVIISFHSLEDRIVKNFFRQEAKDCLCPPELPTCKCYHQAVIKKLTKKVIKPSQEEINNNPRARSARLRAVEKIKI